MYSLSEHLKETIDRVDGYLTGTLIIEDNRVYLERDGKSIDITNSDKVEVRNGDEYVLITLDDALNTKTDEGWPLFAGLYCRVKKAGEPK